VGEWIRRSYSGAYQEEVFRDSSFVAAHIDTRRLRQLFVEHCAGVRDHSYVLWAAWVLERWSRAHGSREFVPVPMGAAEAV
jgi:hypothetical protein